VNDILDFTKLEGDEVVFERIDFDLASVLESTIELFATEACRKGIELMLEYGISRRPGWWWQGRD
jgi:signal transduction histidine kinase